MKKYIAVLWVCIASFGLTACLSSNESIVPVNQRMVFDEGTYTMCTAPKGELSKQTDCKAYTLSYLGDGMYFAKSDGGGGYRFSGYTINTVNNQNVGFLEIMYNNDSTGGYYYAYMQRSVSDGSLIVESTQCEDVADDVLTALSTDGYIRYVKNADGSSSCRARTLDGVMKFFMAPNTTGSVYIVNKA